MQEEENDDGQEELDDDEYIEEEHQFTLNELYAQAHKQLVNGFGPKFPAKMKGDQQISKEDARAWQTLYPRLFGGGLTP